MMISGGGALAFVTEKWTFKCPKCQQVVELKVDQCPHCTATLSGPEVNALRLETKAARTRIVRASAAWVFILLSIFIAAGFIR